MNFLNPSPTNPESAVTFTYALPCELAKLKSPVCAMDRCIKKEHPKIRTSFFFMLINFLINYNIMPTLSSFKKNRPVV
jgi:hypothetical protein